MCSSKFIWLKDTTGSMRLYKLYCPLNMAQAKGSLPNQNSKHKAINEVFSHL